MALSFPGLDSRLAIFLDLLVWPVLNAVQCILVFAVPPSVWHFSALV